MGALIPAQRPNVKGILPYEYLEGLFKTLKASPRVRFLTHDALPFDAAFQIRSEADMKSFYAKELEAWRNQASVEADIEVLLMHDCDTGPAQTVYLCSHQASLGLVSTTSLFVEVPDLNGGRIPYDMDYQQLTTLQKHGQCFTYHCNGPELVSYDDSLVEKQINADVEALFEMGFNIRFFSPHGGRPSVTGINNNSYFYPTLFRRKLIWTHNRFAPSGYRYSDGALMPRLLRGDGSTDLRAYLMGLATLPGPAKASASRLPESGRITKKFNATRRIFILLHPQYYFTEKQRSEVRFSYNTPKWLSMFWDLYERGRPDQFWAPLAEALHARPDAGQPGTLPPKSAT